MVKLQFLNVIGAHEGSETLPYFKVFFPSKKGLAYSNNVSLVVPDTSEKHVLQTMER